MLKCKRRWIGMRSDSRAKTVVAQRLLDDLTNSFLSSLITIGGKHCKARKRGTRILRFCRRQKLWRCKLEGAEEPMGKRQLKVYVLGDDVVAVAGTLIGRGLAKRVKRL